MSWTRAQSSVSPTYIATLFSSNIRSPNLHLHCFESFTKTLSLAEMSLEVWSNVSSGSISGLKSSGRKEWELLLEYWSDTCLSYEWEWNSGYYNMSLIAQEASVTPLRVLYLRLDQLYVYWPLEFPAFWKLLLKPLHTTAGFPCVGVGPPIRVIPGQRDSSSICLLNVFKRSSLFVDKLGWCCGVVRVGGAWGVDWGAWRVTTRS